MPVQFLLAWEPVDELHWLLAPRRPRDWATHVVQCQGGFFHSPAGLSVASPRGEPLFGVLRQAGQVVGIAAGVETRCRLSFHARHIYWPTVPALATLPDRDAALMALVRACGAVGAAEVVVDSFDATWEPGLGPAHDGLASPPRQEYIVPLDSSADEIVARQDATHRRHWRRGEREGWVLHCLDEEAGLAALEEVQAAGVRRAAARDVGGTGRDNGGPMHAPAADFAAPWGTRVLSAWSNGDLLAAALVGWGNRRGFYVRGGSSPLGYERSAAVWLHGRIMALLLEHGCVAYNLGGTAAAAAHPEHAEHGLHRFKAGFGGKVVSCRGARWELRPGHLRVHELVRWASSPLRR